MRTEGRVLARWFALLLLGLALAPASAQTGSVKTQAQLVTEIGTTGCTLPLCNLPDNMQGSATPFLLRQTLQDLTVTMFGGLSAINGITYPAPPYVIGDILYANTTTSMARLADVAVGSLLASGGVGVAPTYCTACTVGGVFTINPNPANPAQNPVAALLRIQSADGLQEAIQMDSFLAGFGGNLASYILFRQAGGTAAAPTATPSGRELGVVIARGYGTTHYSTNDNGALQFNSCEVWSDTAQCTNVKLIVTPIGSNSQYAALTLDPSVSGSLIATFGSVGQVTSQINMVGKISGTIGIAAQDTAGAFLLTLGSASQTSTLTFGGNLTTANSFTTAGNFALTLTTTGATNVTLPTSGTLLAANQTITLSGDVTGSGATAITTVLANIPTATPMAGSLLATNIAAPGVPAGGKTSIYVDSTQKNVTAKNDAGSLFVMVTPTSAGANQFATGIGAGGTISYAQPAFSNISGTASLTQGGTNNSLTASNGGIVWSDASKLNILSGTATANFPLLSGATATPAWATITYPTSATSGGVAYFSSTTAMASSGLMTLNGVIYGGGAGAAPLSTAQGAANTILIANAGAPSFSATPVIGTSLAVGATLVANTTLSVNGNSGTGVAVTFRNNNGNGQLDLRYDTGAGMNVSQTSSAGPIQFNQQANSSLDFLVNNGTYGLHTAASGGVTIGGSQDAGANNLRVNGTINIITLANTATTSAVCYNTGTGLLSYDGTIGTCTVSLLAAKVLTAPLSNEEGFNIVMSLQPWRYAMKKGLPTWVEGEQIGFIADFAAKIDVAQSVVAYNHDGSLAGFRYENYTAALTAAFKHQVERQDSVERRISELQAKIDGLRHGIKQIDRRI